MQAQRKRGLAAVAATAVAVGVAVGGFCVANAATSATGKTAKTKASSTLAPPSGQRMPFGPQRSDETPLTGDDLSKATAAALAKVAGGTVVRAETDADGNAKYEVHMTKADGTPVTVYVDKQFDVVGVETC